MRDAVATARYWGPMLAGFLCLVAGTMAGPIVTWLLFIAGVGLVLDGATAMFERAGATGGLHTHRQ